MKFQGISIESEFPTDRSCDANLPDMEWPYLTRGATDSFVRVRAYRSTHVFIQGFPAGSELKPQESLVYLTCHPVRFSQEWPAEFEAGLLLHHSVLIAVFSPRFFHKEKVGF
jgi:hypothetical protein